MDLLSRLRRRRALVLGGVYLIFALHYLHWRIAGTTIAPLELSEVLRTVHLGVVTAGFLLMLAAVGATLLFGRFFCGWGCHLLAIQDLAATVLAKLGVHPTPPRWRVLRSVPWVMLGYLFVWPLLLRWHSGDPWPGLHVLDDSGGWGSWFTRDPWRNLPGPGVALVTFAVCGPVMVGTLGLRSFCRDACPYGALFGASDRLAPTRIVLTGACIECNRCTAVCPSGLDVLAELRAGGAVRDPMCLRDLDCVAVCPTGGLRVARAAFDLAPARPPQAARPPLGEEVALGALMLALFLIFRGLYGLVPSLLALGLAVLFGVGAMRGHSTFRAWLRAGPRPPLLLATAFALGLGLVAHSAAIRGLELRAESAYAQASRGDPDARTDAITTLTRIERWGALTPPTLHPMLASLYLNGGQLDLAEVELSAALAANPADIGTQRALAAVRAQQAALRPD